MQLDNQKEIAEMQNETQKEIAGIQSATSRQNTKDQVYAQNEMLAYQQKESTARVASFFFQAEDGIRDTSVTGVQTCALPIYFIGVHLLPYWEGVAVDRDPFPVRQEVYADEVDVLRELGVGEPGVPGLGRADRLADGGARAIEISRELLDLQVAAEQDLVADDHAHHVLVIVREVDHRAPLLLVLVAVGIQPGAERDVEPVPVGELGHVGERAADAIGAHRVDLAFEELQVRVDLGIGGHLEMSRVLAGAERRERESLDALRPGGLGRRAIEIGPDREGKRGEQPRDQQAPDGLHGRVVTCAGRRPYQAPVFGIDFQGSAGGSAAPCCSSSMETSSGERTNAMRPSRGGLRIVQPCAIRRWMAARIIP